MAGITFTERRQRQIEETRSAIVTAAAELFAARGYVGTTIEAIAAEAGVVVQTIYNSIGSKSEVLSAVLDRAAAGPESPRPVREFMQQRAEATRDAEGLVRVLADWFTEVQPRTAEVHHIIRQAAAVDEGIADLEERRAIQRFRNYVDAAKQLAARTGAAPLPTEEVAATLWCVGHPQIYRFLVETEGWDLDRYRQWVARLLTETLTQPQEVET